MSDRQDVFITTKQWRSYQAAEAMVSAEVDEVRAEADEIEPGWSQVSLLVVGSHWYTLNVFLYLTRTTPQVIWRQAMQYHNMLKQKHEMEQKAAAEAAKKKALDSAKKNLTEEDKAKAAEKAAEELIKAEEREKASKKAFSGGGVKKGFLDKKK